MSTALTEATGVIGRLVSVPGDPPTPLDKKRGELRRSVRRHVCEFVLIVRTVAEPNDHCGCLGAPVFGTSYKFAELVDTDLEKDFSFPTMRFATSEHGGVVACAGRLSLSPDEWQMLSQPTPGKEDIAVIIGTAAIDEYLARKGDHHVLDAMLRAIELPIHVFETCDMLVRESAVEGNI